MLNYQISQQVIPSSVLGSNNLAIVLDNTFIAKSLDLHSRVVGAHPEFQSFITIKGKISVLNDLLYHHSFNQYNCNDSAQTFPTT